MDGIKILPLGLIALLVWQLLMLAWSFFMPISVEEALVPAPMNIEKTAITTDLNLTDVIALDLFGQVNATKPVEAKREVVISAPETSLNLKLKGVYKSTGDTPSSAIIEGSDKKQVIYFVGELLQEVSRIRLHEIHPRHVILDRGERYEKLVLFGDLQKQEIALKVVGEQGLVGDVLTEENMLPTIDQTQNNELTKRMTKIINDLQNDPLSLKGAMVIQPVEVDNALQGYRVSPGEDVALFKELGFLEGDVITAINNVELTSPSKIMSVIGGLSSATEIEIQTLRDEQPLAFRYSVE